MTHCGSEVKVGVNVEVGSGVSDGRRVGVSVGDAVKVTVVVSVGKGDEVVVQVGVIVGVRGTIRLSPPQPKSKRANPNQINELPRIVALRLRSSKNIRRSAQRELALITDDLNPRGCAGPRA